MKNNEILKLAEGCGIGVAEELITVSEDQLDAFKLLYQEWAAERDRELATEIARFPSKFRFCLKPSDPYFSSLLNQLAWYADEIVVPDWISKIFWRETDEPAHRQDRRRRVSQALELLRKSPFFSEDFVRLSSINPHPESCRIHKRLSRDLVSEPEFVEILKTSLRYGVNTQNIDGVDVHRVVVDLNGTWEQKCFWTLPPKTQVAIPVLIPESDVRWVATEADVRRFIADKGHNEDEFSLEGFRFDLAVDTTLHFLTEALQVSTPAVLSQDYDRGIVLRVAESAPPNQQDPVLAPIELPFLDGLPAGQLLDLRSEEPIQFRVFRAAIYDFMQSAKDDGLLGDHAELRHRWEKTVLAELMPIKAGMEAIEKKARARTTAGTLISASGMLIGGLIGSPEFIATAGIMGVSNAAHQRVDRLDDSKAKESPFYFLWNAQNLIGKK